HLIPQLRRAHELFGSHKVSVVGLHTVFEHHEGQAPASLAAFLKEYQVSFPVGVDRPSGTNDPLPVTMRRYGMQGTPTLMLIDAEGRLRRQTFGHVSDLQLGADIMSLIREGESFASPDLSANDLAGVEARYPVCASDQ
ncbi:MAG: TlpA disulfide reductase family protein, partial [Caulobacter sp.]